IWNTGNGDLRIYAGWDEAATPVSALAANPFGSVAIKPGVGNVNVNSGVDMSGNVLMQAGNNITVQNTSIFVANFSGVDRSLTLNAGNSLQILGSTLEVETGGSGTATLNLAAGAGGITLSGAEGSVFGGCCSATGGGAIASISTTGPFSMLGNSVIEV